MKKTKKSTIAAVAAVLCMASWGLYPVSGHAMTLQDLEKTWGKPAAVVSAENGSEKRFYKYDNTMADLGYRVFQMKGGEIVDLGLTGTAPKIDVALAPGLPVNVISKNFWTGHPTKVEEFMGKPDSVRHLENGTVEMFYKYAGTQSVGYRYFVVKDGQIIASGTTSAALSDPKVVDKAETRTINLSKNYFKNNPTTVEAVEVTWGKPAQIKTLSNGMEERLYKYKGTQNYGYRFFLIQDRKVIASGITG